MNNKNNNTEDETYADACERVVEVERLFKLTQEFHSYIIAEKILAQSKHAEKYGIKRS
jgi:hypothetical protein